MKSFIYFFENFKLSSFCKTISAIGVFDGVHSGHREIIRQARKRANGNGAKVLALSFSPHPRQLLTPDSPPQLLLPVNERVRLLKEAGADFCGFIDFTPEVANMPPEEFLEALAGEKTYDIAGICVGSNWKFGKGGKGDRELIDKFCRKKCWSFDAVDELEFEGKIISSTAIRQAIAAGDLECAKKMLGRPVALYGTVERGWQIASQKLDAPTANLNAAYGVLPPDGVYSGSAVVDDRNYPAAVNIGLAPTFGNNQRRTEVHLIGFTGSLYGRDMCVKLHRFLRPEKRFATPDELKQQIAADIAKIKMDQNPV